ncbi:hypothetical protein MKEN_00592300 [Mycena kentingensis (nom. inval.)]|nr:hypothetical protein MKEN_00592300 [Mycena kentingensis (nom. inval.)]
MAPITLTSAPSSFSSTPLLVGMGVIFVALLAYTSAQLLIGVVQRKLEQRRPRFSIESVDYAPFSIIDVKTRRSSPSDTLTAAAVRLHSQQEARQFQLFLIGDGIPGGFRKRPSSVPLRSSPECAVHVRVAALKRDGQQGSVAARFVPFRRRALPGPSSLRHRTPAPAPDTVDIEIPAASPKVERAISDLATSMITSPSLRGTAMQRKLLAAIETDADTDSDLSIYDESDPEEDLGVSKVDEDEVIRRRSIVSVPALVRRTALKAPLRGRLTPTKKTTAVPPTKPAKRAGNKENVPVSAAPTSTPKTQRRAFLV